MDDQLDDVAEQVRAEHLKTGRDIREILEAMRDEGYIDCTDEALEQCAARARPEQPRGDSQ